MSEPKYPFGVILSVIDSMIGLTFLAYVLYVAGTVLGLIFAGQSDYVRDFPWLIIPVAPYVFLALFTERSIAMILSLPVIGVSWVTAIYSESLKLRSAMLAVIFLTALVSGWFMFSP